MSEDQDLKKINSLLNEGPSPEMIKKWQSSLADRKYLIRRRKSAPWLQLAVAASVGFIIGALAFYRPATNEIENISSDDATIEFITTNSN